MHEVSFKGEILTPLMLAGVNQQAPELRAPSFRGMLRYWHRALLGGLYGTDDAGLREVAKEETDVFGSTAQGSPVMLRLSQEYQPEARSVPGWHNRSQRPALSEGQNFTLMLRMYLSGQQVSLTKAVAALWLLGHFGGVGTRARRGLGNLAITPLEQNSEVSFQTPSEPEALASFLSAGLHTISRPYVHGFLHGVTLARFDALLPDACRIWVLQPDKSWASAKGAFDVLHQEREHLPWKHPLHGRRLACPLILRVVRLGGGQYTGVAVLFQATKYRDIESWVKQRFPDCKEVAW